MAVSKWSNISILLFVIRISGYAKKEMEGKIVGGDFANIRSYPHSVYLSADCDDSWICGSSVLNQRLLITAAHCVEGCVKSFSIDALAGNAVLNQAQVARKVKRYLMHEEYNSKSVYSDIALAMLDNNLPLGQLIQRVWIRPYFSINDQASVAGWGVINDEGDDTIKLKKVTQTVQPKNECRQKLSLLEGMMCAKSGRRGEHPAEGDSGSALVTSSYQQIGLVSFRVRGEKDLIIYSNVSHFYPWIRTKSLALTCFNRS